MGTTAVRDFPLSAEENCMAMMINSSEGEQVYKELAEMEQAEEYIEELIEMEHPT